MNQKIQRIVYVLLICLIGSALVRAVMVTPVAKIQSSEEGILSEGDWKIEKLEEEGKVYTEYSLRLPEMVSKDMVAVIKGYAASISVFLNQEEIYSYQDTYREKGECWELTELPEDAAGGLFTLRILQHSSDIAAPEDIICIGEKNAVFLKVLSENLWSVIWGAVIFLAGAVMGIGSIIIRTKVSKNVQKEVDYLSEFFLRAGIWLITDSRILQLVTGRTGVIALVSFTAFMLMPCSFLKFFEKMMFHKEKSIEALYWLHLINAGISLILYTFRIVPLHQSLWRGHLLLLISIGVVVKTAVTEIVRYKNQRMKEIAVGVGAFLVCGGISLICFYQKELILYPLFCGLGILVLMIFLFRSAFERLKYYMVTSASVERYWKIANTDSMTHLGNRMAFVSQQENSKAENTTCIVMDINDLKKANDKYGHQEGDRLIEAAAECIEEAFGDIGKCYRIGGDEFAVILDSVPEEVVQAGILKMECCMEEKSRGRKVPVRVAYGYAVQENGNGSFEELFHQADVNMYLKKKEMKRENS